MLNTEIKSGCCFVDTADPKALQAGARPTGVVLPDGSRLQTLVGNRLPITPENKLNLGLNYTVELAEGDLVLGATYTFTDEQQAVVFAQPGFRSPSNEVVDFRALWKDADDRYTVIGYVKNAFDELAYQDFRTGAPSASGIQRTTLKPNFPRTYGIEFQYRF